MKELDEATRVKAEIAFPAYYELFMDPDPAAQGNAPFQ